MPAGAAFGELPMELTIGGSLTVGRLGFGAMRITGRGVWGPPPSVSVNGGSTGMICPLGRAMTPWLHRGPANRLCGSTP